MATRKTVSGGPSRGKPFYKGNDAFWGLFGGGTGILAGVIAVTAAIHWLVLAAWILLTGTVWFGLIRARKGRSRILWTAAVAIVLAVLLYNFDAKYVPTAPADQHTDVDLLPPAPVTGDPFFPFRAGQRLNIGIQYINRGERAANETYLGMGLAVCRNPLTAEEEQRIWIESQLHIGITTGGILSPHSQPHYNTVATADPLTPEQVLGLNNGFLALCATARVLWTDATGSYCRYSFQSFHREPTDQTGQAFFNWHTQGSDHNRTEHCDYSTTPPPFWKRWLMFQR